jgi:hypothetical protein
MQNAEQTVSYQPSKKNKNPYSPPEPEHLHGKYVSSTHLETSLSTISNCPRSSFVSPHPTHVLCPSVLSTVHDAHTQPEEDTCNGYLHSQREANKNNTTYLKYSQEAAVRRKLQ